MVNSYAPDHGPQQHKQPPSTTRDTQYLREIKELKETIKQLQEVIKQQATTQQQSEKIINTLMEDRKELKDMMSEMMAFMRTNHTSASSNGVRVTQHDAPPQPAMTATRSSMVSSPAAVGARSRGSSLVNLATQSLITPSITQVTQQQQQQHPTEHTQTQPTEHKQQPTEQPTQVPTRNAFDALGAAAKAQARARASSIKSISSTDEEDNIVSDSDVDMETPISTPTGAAKSGGSKRKLPKNKLSPKKKKSIRKQ